MVQDEMMMETAAGRGNARGRLRNPQEQAPVFSRKPAVMTGEDGMSTKKDMNLKEKERSKENVEEEDSDVQKRCVSREELNVHPNDQEERVQSNIHPIDQKGGSRATSTPLIRRSRATLIRRGLIRRGSRARKSCRVEGSLWSGLSILLFVSQALGAVVIETKQALPPECLEKLGYNGCNELRAHGEDCCKKYPDLVFHCQNDEINETHHSIAACLLEQSVPPGKIGRLIRNETGYPELDLDLDCESNTYRSMRINSSLIRFRYCIEVKKRPNNREDIICDGGPSADALLICKEGFTSQCSHAFRAHDYCLCEPLNRKECSKPFRNVTGKCDDGNITVEYGCTPEARPLSTTTGLTSGASESTPILSKTSSPHPAHTTSTTAPGQDQQGNMSAGKIAGIVIGVICIIAVVILSYCCWQYHSPTNSASGSPSVSSHDERDSAAVPMKDIEDL